MGAPPASFVIAHRSGSDFAVVYIDSAVDVKFEEFSASKSAPTPSNVRRPIGEVMKHYTIEKLREESKLRFNRPNSFTPYRLEPRERQGFTHFGSIPAITKFRFVNDVWEVTVDPASEDSPKNKTRFRYQRNQDGKKWKLAEIENGAKLPSSIPLSPSR